MTAAIARSSTRVIEGGIVGVSGIRRLRAVAGRADIAIVSLGDHDGAGARRQRRWRRSSRPREPAAGSCPWRSAPRGSCGAPMSLTDPVEAAGGAALRARARRRRGRVLHDHRRAAAAGPRPLRRALRRHRRHQPARARRGVAAPARAGRAGAGGRCCWPPARPPPWRRATGTRPWCCRCRCSRAPAPAPDAPDAVAYGADPKSARVRPAVPGLGGRRAPRRPAGDRRDRPRARAAGAAQERRGRAGRGGVARLGGARALAGAGGGARVFVNASRFEDWGIAQMEALAAGTPLVTVPTAGPERGAAACARAGARACGAERTADALAGALRAGLALDAARARALRRRAAGMLEPYTRRVAAPHGGGGRAAAPALDQLLVDGGPLRGEGVVAVALRAPARASASGSNSRPRARARSPPPARRGRRGSTSSPAARRGPRARRPRASPPTAGRTPSPRSARSRRSRGCWAARTGRPRPSGAPPPPWAARRGSAPAPRARAPAPPARRAARRRPPCPECTSVQAAERVEQIHVALLLRQRGHVEQPRGGVVAPWCAPRREDVGVHRVGMHLDPRPRGDLAQVPGQLAAHRRHQRRRARKATRAIRRSTPVTRPRWKPV